MKFGSVPVRDAKGCLLAHSIRAVGSRFRKGLCLTSPDLETLAKAGIEQVTVASLDDDDVGEDEAARRIAEALAGGVDGFTRTAPFTGRVNIHAAASGVVQIDQDAVLKLNCVDDAITLATLPHLSRVAARTMVATVKVITYAASEQCVVDAEAAAGGALRLQRPVINDASLVITRIAGQRARLAEKGALAVAARLEQLDVRLLETVSVAHETEAVGDALAGCRGELVLLLTGSATSDPDDVGPAALRRAGGSLRRFGMPVDPGNLLFHGALNGRPVIGLPGCARSPALNGADWMLERIACGIDVTRHDIAAMGVGGLLKEIPTRPQPRAAARETARRPVVEIIVLDTGGKMALRDVLAAATESAADRVRVVSANGLDAELAKRFPNVSVAAPPFGSDRSGLIRAGVSAIDSAADAVLLAPADAPLASARQFDRLIAAFSPADGREICRIARRDGRRGPPALFGRRFFESLTDLKGARGAVSVAEAAAEFTIEIEP